MNARNLCALAAVVAATLSSPAPAAAQSRPLIVAGSNLFLDHSAELDVPYSGFVGRWFVDADLANDPSAAPMIKRLQSPMTDTGSPILLDALQPFPQRIDEDFHLAPDIFGAPIVSREVRDWHEEILTPGFVWVIPSDATDVQYPGLFPADVSLITKNGAPHDWDFIPSPALPNLLNVQFPPILPGEVLDIHKAILWIGTLGNRIWGDNRLDDGSPFDESRIRVREYPTVPEPATASLAALGLIAASERRRRR